MWIFFLVLSTVSAHQPLFLTPYLTSNNAAEARKLSQVKPPILDIRSYSGFLTVNETYSSNLFFWFFPSKINSQNVPLIIWVNGLKTPSTYGIFTQTGPYKVINNRLTLRTEAWTNYYNVLYIDSPLGTGFSFTNSTQGFSKTSAEVGNQINLALIQFYKIFPEFKQSDLYVSSLSFGGKYGPSIADSILKSKNRNLKGLLLGNPFSDPPVQAAWGTYLYNLGIINEKGMNYFLEQEQIARTLMVQGKNLEALFIVENLMTSDNSYFFNLTGFPHYYNHVDLKEVCPAWMDYIQKPHIRKSIHVGDLELLSGDVALTFQALDILTTSKPILEKLLNNKVKLLLYNGEYDIICGYPMMAEVVRSLDWSGGQKFRESPRTPWWNGPNLLGFVQKYGLLTEVLVRGSGHMVAHDDPKISLEILRKFLSNEF